jgi:hypothetical protein
MDTPWRVTRVRSNCQKTWPVGGVLRDFTALMDTHNCHGIAGARLYRTKPQSHEEHKSAKPAQILIRSDISKGRKINCAPRNKISCKL